MGADGEGGRLSDFRVRLLGEFERYTPDFELIEPQPNNKPRPEDARLLALLVLHRVGQPIPEADLLRVGWDNGTGDRDDLQPALSRLRGAASIYGKDRQLPITMNRVNRTYTLALVRHEVDASYFIASVDAGLPTEPTELGHLSSLWRANPFKIYGNVPDFVWKPLKGALDTFKIFLRSLPSSVAHRIADWDRFWSLWDDQLAPGPRILIVDDDPSFVESLQTILTGFTCECAYSLEQALRVIATHGDRPFAAAIIDLHLTSDTDALGVAVLEEMSRVTPDVPRILLTRNPLDDGQMDAVRKYGLFDVYKKRSPATAAAPQLRSVVDAMLSDNAMRLRARAEVDIARLDRSLGRSLAKAQRSGQARKVQVLEGLLQRYSAAAEDFETRLEKDDTLDRDTVDDFVAQWKAEIDRQVSDVT